MSVLDLVARETRRASRAAGAAGVLLPVVFGLVTLTVGAIWLARGRWLALPAAVPFLVWIIAAAVATLIARRVRRRLAARAHPAAVARAIEEEQHLRRGQLTGLLEVAESGGVFAQRTAERLGASLAAVADRPAPVHRRRFRRALALSVIALAHVLVLAGSSWATRADGWQALLSPVEAWRGTLLPPLGIVDAPRRLPRGASAAVVVDAPGRRDVRLQWRVTGGAWRDTLLAVGAEGVARVTFGVVDADLVLVADDGRSLSDTVLIRVVDRPFVGDVTLRASYPAYLARAPERLAADAPVRIPSGTRLSLEGHSSEPLAAVALVAGAARVALRSEGTSFTGAWTPARSDVWSWEAKGLRQEIADLPAALEIEVLEDSVPRVEILAPVGEVLVGLTDRVGIEILAQDDHALIGVWMRRWVVDAEGRASEPRDYPLSDARESEWVGGAVQDLSRLDLAPGSTVHLVAVARDAAAGDREGRSRPLVLRVLTTAEERVAAREAGDAAAAAASAAARAQAALAEQTETASRSRTDRAAGAQSSSAAGERPRNPTGMAYENAEQAREIAERQRALQERVAALEEAAREMEDRLRRAGALDTSLARQLQDAQRLLREAMTPEMAEALRKLEGSAQQLDGDRTRQSLTDLAAQQQRLREALEKSAQMLKRAALEGSMETLKDEAKELANAQQQFAEGAERTAPDPNRAERLGHQTRDLTKAIEALKDRLEQERANTGAAGAERAEEQARRSESALEEARQQARAALAQNQTAGERERAQSGAREAASAAADAMQQAAQSLERARNGQVSEWKGELTDALDRSVQEMLQLAREQDALAQQAQREPNDPNLRSQQAALQQGVQTAQRRLEEEGKKSALVSPRTQQMMDQAQQRVAQATRESAQAQRGQQSQAMQEAANSLRQAAAQLTRDRERAASASSASGLPELMQQLQQLAQQQGQLNGQMQSIFPGGQSQGQRPDALDEAGRAQARELARAQREVARQLDEVSDSDPTGRAQEMAREARLLAQALDQGAVDPATQARQERLFRRMLDAGRSLEQEQRDETQRRESRAARGIERFTPAAGAARGREAERFTVPTWEELRGLSAEERRLVIEYFRRLNTERAP